MRRLTTCYPPLFLVILTLFFNLTLTYSQTSSGKKIGVKEALDKVSELFGTKFVYERSTVRNKTTTVDVALIKTMPVEEILKSILYPNSLLFLYVDKNHYTIVPKSSRGETAQYETNSSPEVSVNNANAASDINPLNIKGSVTDSLTNEPLVGVTVSLKGTSTGDVTDNSGRFSINSRNASNPVLEFSMVGYEKKQLSVDGKSDVSIVLAATAGGLGEVVVVGYGTQRKRDITGAVSSISEEKIKALPISRFEQAIQGRVAGVNVTSNSGAPGGAVSVRIRGIGTIGNNQPLYVIDGIPVFGDGALNTISTNDIQSLEVLKDASATAIYGARAANGVIIVTTKRGKEGKVVLNYDGFTAMQQVARQYNMLNSEQFALLSNEMRSAQRTDPLTPEWGYPENIPGGVDTDWQREIFRSALMQNHSISLSGGSQNSQYLLSGNYFNQDGIVKGSGFKRYSLRVNTDTRVFERVKIGTSLLFSRTNELLTGGAGNIESALRQLPTIPVKFADGSWGGPQGAKEYYNDVTNPVAQIAINDNTSGRYRFLGNIFGEIELAKGFTFRSSYSYDLSIREDKNFSPTYQFGVLFSATANVGNTNARATTQVWENILNYSRTFSDKHTVSLLGVFSAQESSASSEFASATGLISNELPYLRAFDPAGIRNIGSNIDESALLSYTARANYAFADKYLFSATIRRDGSSKFGKNYPYANFPAFSAGWRLSEESFMKDITFLSDLKIRGSWGQSGNQEIGNYPFASALNNTRRYVFGTSQTIVSGVAPTSLANPDVRWETATQTNFGLDVVLFRNSLDFSANYYIKKTTDILVEVPIPLTSGITSFPYVNAGSIENSGVELEMNYRHTNKIGIRYQVGANLSTVNNRVLSLGSGRPIYSGSFLAATNGRGGQNVTVTREGDPIGSFYGYIVEGIFQNQIEINEHARQSTATRPGDIKFKNLNKDNIIDANDRVIIGNPIPDFIFGLNGSISYKNLDINIFFQGVKGNEIYNGTRSQIASMFAVQNQSAEVLNRWRGEGTSTTVPRAVQLDPAENGRNSTRWIEDGSYVRFKNLALGYNLPTLFTERIKAQKARLYVSATNLLTLTNYTGLDPEVGERGQSALFSGVDQNIYPVARTFTVGINMNF